MPKNIAKKDTVFNSSYWLPNNINIFKLKKDLNVNDYVYYLNSISTFVNILTGRTDIKLKYTSSSYTDTTDDDLDDNVIKITADLRTPHKFDVTVGLTLHEAGHILLTDKQLFDKYINYITKHGDKELFDNVIPTKNDISHFTTLFNIIEDLRVYNYILHKCPGYIGYYNTMLDEYFNDEQVNIILNNEKIELPEQTWNNYIFNITNIQNPLITNVLECLPHLAEIYNILSSENIDKLKSSSDTIKLTRQIFKLINNVAIKDDEDEKEIKAIDRIIKIINEKQQSYIDGNITKTDLDKRMYDEVDTIIHQPKYETTTSQLSINDNIVKIPCIVIKGFDNIDDYYSYIDRGDYTYKKAVIDGITYGTMLSSKLKAYYDTVPLTTYRVKHGKLSNRLLYSCEYNDNIFQYDDIVKIPNQYMHISIDGSNSMQGIKWANSIKCAVAIAKATEYIPNIHVVISIRTSSLTMSNSRTKGYAIPCLWIIYDSSTDKIDSLVNDIASIQPMSWTPEGLCFESILDCIVADTKEKKSFFINFSDGDPCMPINIKSSKIEILRYQDEIAINHTASMVNKLKRNDVKVLSFFIDDNNSSNIISDDFEQQMRDFKQMYGNDARYFDINNINLLINTLNNFFISNE